METASTLNILCCFSMRMAKENLAAISYHRMFYCCLTPYPYEVDYDYDVRYTLMLLFYNYNIETQDTI